MLKVDKFSNHIYLTTGNIKTNETGDVFVKAGNDYIAQNGDYIQKTGSSYLNLRTGVNSTFGDPFEDDKDE
jgi:hypothetical protein